jgi:hypothetical protein
MMVVEEKGMKLLNGTILVMGRALDKVSPCNGW